MTGFLARRLANYVLLCLVATFLAFSLASLAFTPLGQLQARNPPPPTATVEAKRAELRLDEPIPLRFAGWLGGAVQGDFGSTITGQPITDQLGRRIGVSLRLFALGTLVGIAVGVVVGVAGAIRQYRASDYAATLFSFLILSTPVFLVGTLLKFGGLRLNETAGTTVLYFTGARQVQQFLAQIGVQVDITPVPLDDLFEKHVNPGNFDITHFSWIGVPFPVSSKGSIYGTRGDTQQNFGGIGNETINNLVAEANRELDPARKIELANQIDREIWQTGHSLISYQRPDVIAVREGVANFGAFGFADPVYTDIGFRR